MAKKKMTTGSGSKQRSVKERPGSAGAGTKSSLQAKGRDDEDSAAVAHAAQQERAAHARSVKAQKLLRRREVLELRQR
ncbi:hypothetical protein PR002_g18114 [Phytophthora rubi]|uniref:Uncharacterized protein n=1 Tax=Phytophthora rubi TaxID=129364 RepID=A0A6A3K0S5_9STRA|nr:hypothetical protein PR002_g18114 [Phytophthora rubi]